MSKVEPGTIDEVLTRLENIVAQDVAQRMSGNGGRISPKRHHQEAKAALSAMISEIIGEDYIFERPLDDYFTMFVQYTKGKNEGKQEARQRAIAKGFILEAKS